MLELLEMIQTKLWWFRLKNSSERVETRGEKRAAFAHGLGAADGTHGMDFAAAGWLPEVFGQAGLGFGTRKGSMKSFKSHRIQMHKTRYLQKQIKAYQNNH